MSRRPQVRTEAAVETAATATTIGVLVVEPNEETAQQLLAHLQQAGSGNFRITHVRTLASAATRMRHQPHEVVLLDIVDGIDAALGMSEVRSTNANAAIIVLTRADRQDEAVAAVHSGAQDFLVLEQLTVDTLARVIYNAVERQRMLQVLRERMQQIQAEEQRFRTIVQTTTDAIVIVDADGQIRFANPAAEQLFGRSERELVESPFGFPVVIGATTEIDVVRSDGTLAVAELRVAETQWEGAPAAIASLRDITERRLSEERERTLVREQAARAEAEASERRARFLAEAGSVLADSLDHQQTLRSLARLVVPFIADWCIVDLLDRDGSIQRVAVTYADPAHRPIADRLASFSPERATLLGVPRVLRTGRAELVADISDAYLQRLTKREDYLETIRAVRPRSVIIVPLIARGRPLGTIVLIAAESGRRYNERDVAFAEELARRAAIAVDNARLYQEAQQANQSKADFLAVMSHELRTPLNAVIGYADLLLMGVPVQLPTVSRDHVQRIRASARHLLRLIEEILTYARMEAGREELNLDSFDVAELIRDVVTIIEPAAQEKQLALHVEAPKAPIRLHTDAGKLQQILINLLTNAIKFTESGEIGLAFGFEAGAAVFTVWDTGIGIRPELLPRIFDPFWQAELSRTRRAEGTGLGLTVARRLARLLGGDIEVQSVPDTGSQFKVRIAPSLTKPAD